MVVSCPTNILLVTFLIPISAILLGYLVLGERLEWNAFAGMGMVFMGLIAIDGRWIKRFKRKNVWCYEIWQIASGGWKMMVVVCGNRPGIRN